MSVKKKSSGRRSAEVKVEVSANTQSVAERRAAEAHSIVERMRTEFELEREDHATAERELRGRLASETEQHQALREAYDVQQARAEVLSPVGR